MRTKSRWTMVTVVGVGGAILALSLLGSEPRESGLAATDEAPAAPSAPRGVFAYMGSTALGVAPSATSTELVDLAEHGALDGLGWGDSTPIVEETGGDTYDDGETQELADEEVAALEGTPIPEERLPLDYEALGYPDEAAMHHEVRARLAIPEDQAIALYGEVVDGEEVVTLAVGMLAEGE